MRRLLVVPALACVAAASHAEPYVVGHLGYASADWHLGAPFNGTVDDRAFGFGADVGIGWQHWAVEAGISWYSDVDGVASPCPAGVVCPLALREVTGNDMTTYKVAVVPRFEIGDTWLFAKAGWYRMDIDTNIDLPGDELDDDGFLLGLGVRWYFSDPWSVSVEGLRFDDNQYEINVGFGWGLRPFRSDRDRNGER